MRKGNPERLVALGINGNIDSEGERHFLITRDNLSVFIFLESILQLPYHCNESFCWRRGGKLSTGRRQMKLIDANLSPNEFSIEDIKKMSPAGELLL